jgi:methylmalonic aciduria homocystinuria type C protein
MALGVRRADDFAIQTRWHLRVIPPSWHGRHMVTRALAAAGFDVVQAFDALACAREPGLAILGDPARRRGYLVGSTRALWPRFVAARAADPALDRDPNPIERFTVETIDWVAASLPDARVFYTHRQYDGAFLPFQRLAVASGLGALAPTHLVIHPIYGPWFSLRAAIVCAGEPPATSAPITRCCACTNKCGEAFERAVAATTDRPAAWLAVRDACTAGREHRYTDEQIAYHYSFLR